MSHSTVAAATARATKIAETEDRLYLVYDTQGWRAFEAAYNELSEVDRAAFLWMYNDFLDYEAGGSHWSETASERAFGC